MLLTKEEQAMLDGEQGEGVQKAMEIIVALARIYDAEKLVPVTSVQVSGVSYKNLGDAGIDFLNEWAKKGARVRVPTTLNPAGMDLDNWKEFGFGEAFARKQIEVVSAFEAMGIPPSCSCTPYLTGNVPRFGDHVAWGESSAVSYCNSVIGARTNREGGPSALAAAVTGRTGAFEYHLDEKRKANYIISVDCPVKEFWEYGALGNIVGKKVKGVPFFKGIHPNNDELKALGASMTASGGIALYHVDDVTPEARMGGALGDNVETIHIESLKEAVDSLNTGGDAVDFAWIGCPHASIEEIKEIALMVKGKRLKAELWVTTAKQTRALAERMHLVDIIHAAGGKVLSDTCAVVAPLNEFKFTNAATNSGKGAWYLNNSMKVRFGSTKQCINAALTGRWK
jgi:hypothetical protein